MKARWLLLCVLAGCVFDASLGEHEPLDPDALAADEMPAPMPQDEPDTMTEADPALASGTEAMPEPAAEPAPEEPAAPEPAAGDPTAAEPPAAQEPPPADMPAPMAEPVPVEPPPADVPVEPPPPECTPEGDNPCFLCEVDACCAERLACLEHAGCHCRMECRTAEQPAVCMEACDAGGDVYEPWVACLEASCADSC